MRHTAALAPCVAMVAVAFAHAGALLDGADSILGLWLTADQEGYVEITETSGVYQGTIVGGPDDTERFDEKNPDPRLRDRPLLGLTIMTGFTSTGDGKWTGGRIYDPNNGKTYKCTLELGENGTLKVRGYVGISWFGRTETWTRTEGVSGAVDGSQTRD